MPAHFRRHFRVTIVDFFLSVCGKVVWRWPWASSFKEFHESPPKNAAPAFYGSQLRRKLKLSQELGQISQFFSDLLRLRMAAAEEQCRAPGVLGRSGNTSQQQGTAGDRFSPYHWLNQSDKQRPPVIHECRHSSDDLRALEILGCEPAPTSLFLQFFECVLRITPIPIELGKCEVLPLPLQRGHHNSVFPNRIVRINHFGKPQKQLVAFCGPCWQHHVFRWLPTPTHDNDTSLAVAPAHQLQFCILPIQALTHIRPASFCNRHIHFVQTISAFCGHDLLFPDILLKYRAF